MTGSGHYEKDFLRLELVQFGAELCAIDTRIVN